MFLRKITGIFIKGEKRVRPRSIFGDISAREEKKIWKEITRKAIQDQEKVIRKAEEIRKEWEKNGGMSEREKLEREGFVFPDYSAIAASSSGRKEG